jgi:hypothetical protein
MSLALIVGLLGWFTQSLEVKWVVAAASLALIAVGLGVNSFLISLNTERRINDLNTNLTRIEHLQIEMQKEQKEQKEQSGSGSMIIPTLETFSKFYLDYLNKQKGEGEEANTNDTEGIEGGK